MLTLLPRLNRRLAPEARARYSRAAARAQCAGLQLHARVLQVRVRKPAPDRRGRRTGPAQALAGARARGRRRAVAAAAATAGALLGRAARAGPRGGGGSGGGSSGGAPLGTLRGGAPMPRLQGLPSARARCLGLLAIILLTGVSSERPQACTPLAALRVRSIADMGATVSWRVCTPS
jgi:hypothetical protein